MSAVEAPRLIDQRPSEHEGPVVRHLTRERLGFIGDLGAVAVEDLNPRHPRKVEAAIQVFRSFRSRSQAA